MSSEGRVINKSGPLSGRRIVVTRTADQAGAFTALLESAGAEVIGLPTIKTVPPKSNESLDAAIAGLPGYDYAVFTSANAVKFFFRRLGELGGGPSKLLGVRTVVVGKKTAAELMAHGVEPDILPAEFKAEGVLAALSHSDITGARVLFPRAEVARELLPDMLRQRGAVVTLAVAYRTVAPEAAPEQLEEIFSVGVSAITFTSSSTVRNFVEMAAGRADEYLRGVCIACIGPVTAGTCEELGIEVTLVPEEYTVEALLDLLIAYFKKEKD